MFPRMRQRLIIITAVVVGAIGWMSVADWLRAPDGSTGLSLTTAKVGWGWAVLAVGLAGLPALVLGLFVSVMGNPLAGIFSISAALTVLAGSGGSINGWVWRDEVCMPEAYGGLIIEMIIWEAGLVAMLAVVQFLRSPMRRRMAALVFDDHLGVEYDSHYAKTKSLAAGLICAVVAGVATFLLLRSSDTGQVVWSLILAFLLGGMSSQLIVPQCHPWAIVLSPVLVAVVGYTWVLTAFTNEESFWEAWNLLGQSAMHIPGPALALPVHYASAAVVGCTLGVGWAQNMNAARARVVEA